MINVRNLEQQLKAIANARRIAILVYIKQKKSATAGEIADAVGVKMPAASQHLRILKAAGIVEYKRRGKFVAYRISLKQEEPIKKTLSMM